MSPYRRRPAPDEIPPVIQDVVGYCAEHRAMVPMRMVAYPDEVTFRCKLNQKHVFRFTRDMGLPDWNKPPNAPLKGVDDEE